MTRCSNCKQLEKALGQERVGLTAIAAAFLHVGGQPERLMARVEAQARQAQQDSRVADRTKASYILGHRILARAFAIDQGKPQPLFDDEKVDVGHTDASAVQNLIEETGPDQLGLLADGSLGDATAALEEQTSYLDKLESTLVALFREFGALTDAQLFQRYQQRPGAPYATFDAVKKQRATLSRRGALGLDGDHKGAAQYGLIET